jgi:outer membrane protein assembly factor BamD
MVHKWATKCVVLMLCIGLMSGCFRRKKYENPITKDTQQPDKVLYDKAIRDLEKSRFEVSRLTLQTLINTYDTSEFLAKAKLAIADSWFREGGTHGLAQAEAEYKDFILFYPALEEAAEAQEKVCMIHYRQMEKADRDMSHALRAEDECRQLLVQFPNSKFAPQAQQLLRNIQEVIADGEFRVGYFYHGRGKHPAASNRLQSLVDQFPLYSLSDEALWLLGDSYTKMGPRFRDKAAASYARIVKDYPLSSLSDDAKKKLREMEAEIPEPDPVAVARMKYELENRTKAGMLSKSFGLFRKSPDTHAAAKSGSPSMERARPTIPVSVPPAASAVTAGTTDVTVSTTENTSALDKNPDARAAPPKPEGEQSTATSSTDQQQQQPLPTNRSTGKQKKQKKQKQTPPPSSNQ